MAETHRVRGFQVALDKDVIYAVKKLQDPCPIRAHLPLPHLRRADGQLFSCDPADVPHEPISPPLPLTAYAWPMQLGEVVAPLDINDPKLWSRMVEGVAKVGPGQRGMLFVGHGHPALRSSCHHEDVRWPPRLARFPQGTQPASAMWVKPRSLHMCAVASM